MFDERQPPVRITPLGADPAYRTSIYNATTV